MPTPFRSHALRAVLVAAAAAASLVFAAQSFGDTCETCGGGGGGGGPVITHPSYTLTTTPPSQGTITGTGINCGADCWDQVTYTCSDGVCPAPAVRTLSASGGPAGFAPSWSGCTALHGIGAATTCDVTMDQDRSVSLTWADITDPTVTLGAVAAKSGSAIAVSATAGDNAGLSKVEFYLDGSPALTVNGAGPSFSGSISTSSLADGSSHTVTAQATDTSNRQSALSAGQSTVIDKNISLALGSAPAQDAYVQSASLPFTLDSDSTAQCRAYATGGVAPGFTSCSTPFAPALATDGAYTFDVKASDGANTITQSRSFTLDRIQPALGFTDGPPEGSVVGTPTVTFTFSSSDASPFGVQCSVDSGAYGACTSATTETLSGMSATSHTLDVRSTDAAGNARTVRRNFGVSVPANTGSNDGANGTNGSNGSNGSNGNTQAADTSAPLVKLSAKAKQKLKSKAIVLSLNSNEGGIAGAKAMFGKSAVSTLSKTVAAGNTKLTLKLSKKVQKALAKALKRKKTVSIKILVTVRDLAGNGRPVTKSVTLGR
jgi:hypothetical protein